ncbi:MAG: addiction module protein [Bacteroidota bacterium]|nr:addiction module protein [Bacteroidota bacterium]MDP4232505.1 addiction module protein [Bacteroidota bacterium]MDP4241640.1 addiction module protein [Bacteroidota bacterium]MDP4286385.1 addiction module protein [Bacteroidota bacterium]
MDRDFESIAADAERLDTREQILLAQRLMRNAGPSHEHREAWLAESQRRAEAYDRGEMEAFDGDDVMRELHQLIRSK